MTRILLITVLAGVAAAQTELHVPATYPTIQSAIDVAVDGDTVVVAPGFYFEHINAGKVG